MGPTSEIKVSLYDDNNSLRDSITQLIIAFPDFQLAGCFANALYILEDISINRPDVILMDINMPGISGVEAVKKVKQHDSGIRILMQTVFDDDDNIFKAICAGADGYILKKTSPSDILDSIRNTYHGQAVISPSIATRILSMFRQQAAPSKNTAIDLSDREKEILDYLTKGLSYQKIALKCYISIDTVRFHIKHIYAKLHVHSMAEAVSKALKEKLI